jgi:tRNA-dihydrouridine synthase
VGYNKVQINEWIPFLLSQGLEALTIHARTRKEMSLVPARWEHVREVVEIRDKMNLKTKIIGNGDVRNLEEARMRVKETGCDGVMLGRAIFGNPWLFAERIPTVEEKLQVMIEHTKLFEELLGKYKNFAIMKKHYKAYVNGFDRAKELRMKLMECENSDEIKAFVDNFLSSPNL